MSILLNLLLEMDVEIIKLQSYGIWANDDLVSKILTAAGENTNE